MPTTKIFGILLFILTSSFLLTGCDTESNPYRVDFSLAEANLFDITGIESRTTESGLIIYDLEQGTGSLEVVSRDNILLYYTIRFKPNDAIIESSYANNSNFPVQFNGIVAEANRIGDGFVEGVIGMKEGEKRVVMIPTSESVYSDTVIVDLELDSILY